MTDKNTLDLAREWAADIDADRETLSQDTIDAAADLISSLTDAWVGADTLRKYIADWREGLATAPRGNYEAEMLDDLEDMLPAPPKPADPRKTLADMAPEERAECQWMQAKDDVGNHVIITELDEENQEGKVLYENGGQFEWPYEILVPLPYLPRLEWPGSEPEETHFDDLPDEVKQVMEESVEDYKAGRFVDFDTSESASPRPEDVPVGEPWQVEVDGKAAVGCRNDPASNLPWTLVRQDKPWFDYPSDDDVKLVSRLAPETTEQDPSAEHFTDAPLRTVNWDREEVPEGYAEVTFLIPETRRRWGRRTVADLTIKDKTNDQ